LRAGTSWELRSGWLPSSKFHPDESDFPDYSGSLRETPQFLEAAVIFSFLFVSAQSSDTQTVASRASVPRISLPGKEICYASLNDLSNQENPLHPDETLNSVTGPSGNFQTFPARQEDP
jgi:hypothetical protein